MESSIQSTSLVWLATRQRVVRQWAHLLKAAMWRAASRDAASPGLEPWRAASDLDSGLTLTQRLVLETEPELVARVARRLKYPRLTLQALLDRLAVEMANRRLRALQKCQHDDMDIDNYKYFKPFFRYGTAHHDLINLTPNLRSILGIIGQSVRYGHQEMLVRWATISRRGAELIGLQQAFTYRQRHIIDVLTSPPFNLQPTLKTVCVGGQQSDLDRFGLREQFRRWLPSRDFIPMPELMDLWASESLRRFPMCIVEDALKSLIQACLEKWSHPELLAWIIDCSPFARDNIRLELEKPQNSNWMTLLIDKGRPEMLQVLVSCL